MSVFQYLQVRRRQGVPTSPFPDRDDSLPERFRGRPALDAGACLDGCRDCASRMPTGILKLDAHGTAQVDAGASLFSPDEAAACPSGALRFTTDFRMASSSREGLVSRDGTAVLARELDSTARSLFGRALRLRSVSAGSCNGCEAELVALGNVVFDMARFGIQFVASPRHADGLVITGAVSRNMERALRDTWDATPEPRIVVAVGACAINGGPFRDSPQVLGGVPDGIPVDLWVPGCPPHPLTMLDGLLRLLGRHGGGASARTT